MNGVMDSKSAPSRLFVNLLSQVWGRLVSNIGARLLRVPLLLTALGPDDYGRWLVLASLSSWLSIPQTGTATVAAGSMSIATGGGDLSAARRTYSDLFVFNSVLFICLALAAFLASAFLPVHTWLGFSAERSGECGRALFALCIGVLLAGMAEVFGARLKASGKSHLPALWQGVTAWLEIVALFAVVG